MWLLVRQALPSCCCTRCPSAGPPLLAAQLVLRQPLSCLACLLVQEDGKEGDSKERRTPAAWAYIRSLAWVRPILILAVLYICALSVILALFYQLPSLSQLAGTWADRGRAALGDGSVATAA